MYYAKCVIHLVNKFCVCLVFKGLKKVMKKLVASDAQEKLAVADAKLGQVIKKKFELQTKIHS